MIAWAILPVPRNATFLKPLPSLLELLCRKIRSLDSLAGKKRSFRVEIVLDALAATILEQGITFVLHRIDADVKERIMGKFFRRWIDVLLLLLLLCGPLEKV